MEGLYFRVTQPLVLEPLALAIMFGALAACDAPPDWSPPGDAAGSDVVGLVDAPAGGGDADGGSEAGGGSDAGSGSDAGGGSDGGGGVLPADYSIVVLPDTQYYAAAFPDIFMEQTRWIVDHRDEQQIGFVLHTGDVTDDDGPEQWEVASRSLHLLDGVVPYMIAAGNHDYHTLADRMGMANVYFPPSAFTANPWFGGTFEPEHIENAFSLITVGATRWVVLSLEFGPRDEALAWASSILEAFRDRPAIVITHAYLYHDSSRYNASGPPQNFNPHAYAMMGQPRSSINDGEEMWQKLIVPNRNVKLVFSGHDVNFGDLPPGTTGRLSSARPDGSVVHQILANYQTCTGAPCALSYQGTVVNGGNGFLRIVRFSAVSQTISVSTYSPHLDRWLDDPANRFDLPMN
jgi:hypothetical protein